MRSWFLNFQTTDFFFFRKCWTDICNYNSALKSEEKWNFSEIYKSYPKFHELIHFEIVFNLAVLQSKIFCLIFTYIFRCNIFNFLVHHTKSWRQCRRLQLAFVAGKYYRQESLENRNPSEQFLVCNHFKDFHV